MTYPTFQIELKYLKKYQLIAGVDEAGRGPLAGPVVAAAVILNPALAGSRRTRNKWWRQLRDSKQLPEKTRIDLEKVIKYNSLGWAVGIIEPRIIDKINIHQASLAAMGQAVSELKIAPDFLLVDGQFKISGLAIKQKTIIKGDVKILSIAAASIIAKVYRDRLMLEAHKIYPQYRFDKHKGYPTTSHRQTLHRYGPCPLHRRSFLKTIDL